MWQLNWAGPQVSSLGHRVSGVSHVASRRLHGVFLFMINIRLVEIMKPNMHFKCYKLALF